MSDGCSHPNGWKAKFRKWTSQLLTMFTKYVVKGLAVKTVSTILRVGKDLLG